MNTNHLRPFLDAMQSKDTESLAPHLALDVVIHSPIVSKPFEGKSKSLAVLGALIGVVDQFEVTDILVGDTHVAVVLEITVGKVKVQGVDYLHVNDAGLIDSMTIQWRPLPSIVEIQQRLAPMIGMPPLKLTEN